MLFDGARWASIHSHTGPFRSIPSYHDPFDPFDSSRTLFTQSAGLFDASLFSTISINSIQIYSLLFRFPSIPMPCLLSDSIVDFNKQLFFFSSFLFQKVRWFKNNDYSSAFIWLSVTGQEVAAITIDDRTLRKERRLSSRKSKRQKSACQKSLGIKRRSAFESIRAFSIRSVPIRASYLSGRKLFVQMFNY